MMDTNCTYCCPVTAVYRMANAGKLPGFKVNQQWRFDR
jgi:hypothetical protein